MDCSPPGSPVLGILQARILEWVAISFSSGSSRPRNRTWVSCTAGRFFTNWATREASELWGKPRSGVARLLSLPSSLKGPCPASVLFSWFSMAWWTSPKIFTRNEDESCCLNCEPSKTFPLPSPFSSSLSLSHTHTMMIMMKTNRQTAH